MKVSFNHDFDAVQFTRASTIREQLKKWDDRIDVFEVRAADSVIVRIPYKDFLIEMFRGDWLIFDAVVDQFSTLPDELFKLCFSEVQ